MPKVRLYMVSGFSVQVSVSVLLIPDTCLPAVALRAKEGHPTPETITNAFIF